MAKPNVPEGRSFGLGEVLVVALPESDCRFVGLGRLPCQLGPMPKPLLFQPRIFTEASQGGELLKASDMPRMRLERRDVVSH